MTTLPDPTPPERVSAFIGHRRVARGSWAEVAGILGQLDVSGDQVIVLDDDSGALLDVPTTRHPPADAAAPAAQPPLSPPTAGRPRLGVVAREVTLLPRHWQWLGVQPSGASAALRRLVDDARKTHAGRDRRRGAKERTYRFMQAVCGNLPGFEQAARLLFAHDRSAFAAQIHAWPTDVREHATMLADEAFDESHGAVAAAPAPALLDVVSGAVHLVVGPLGAGKSTYAAELAERLGGVVFSIDAWMKDLYGPDVQADTALAWVRPRVRRCEARIWITALALARRGVPAVLDVAGLTAADRQRFREWARDADVPMPCHYLDASRELRRARVAQRNAHGGPTFVFVVTPAMFDHMDGLFEPPAPAELGDMHVVSSPRP